jgi:hypothetical protein
MNFISTELQPATGLASGGVRNAAFQLASDNALQSAATPAEPQIDQVAPTQLEAVVRIAEATDITTAALEDLYLEPDVGAVTAVEPAGQNTEPAEDPRAQESEALEEDPPAQESGALEEDPPAQESGALEIAEPQPELATEAAPQEEPQAVEKQSILVERGSQQPADKVENTQVERESEQAEKTGSQSTVPPDRESLRSTATNSRIRSQEAAYEKDCALSRNYLLNRELSDISLNIAVTGKPGEDFPISCDIGTHQMPLTEYRQGQQEPLNFAWTASGLCHKPLYFRELQAERYGHTIGHISQPFLSAAHFFCNTAILPYKMGMRPPQECVYALGHYRPGDPAPRYIPAVPISIRGTLMQAAAVLGVVYVLP